MIAELLLFFITSNLGSIECFSTEQIAKFTFKFSR